MRTLSLLSSTVLSAAVLTACDGGVTEPPFLPDTSPTPTEEATSTPEPTPAAVLTPSPTLEPTDLEGFREFASQVEAAVEGHNADFFMDIADISTAVCPEAGIMPMLRCEELGAGTVIEGIWLSRWQSEPSLLTVDEFRDTLGDYLASPADPTLYAIAALSRNIGGTIGGPAFFAIVASSNDLETTTRVFEFVSINGEWRMPVVINTSNLAADWLSGQCRECYDHWERWEGTP